MAGKLPCIRGKASARVRECRHRADAFFERVDLRRRNRWLNRGGAEELRVDGDLDVVRDHHPSRLERLIPRQTELRPVDLRRRTEPRADIAPRIVADALAGDIEDDLTRHAANREVTDELEAALG